MVVLKFKPEFLTELDDGAKTRTIRRTRADLKPGDTIWLETDEGMEIRRVTCTRVRPVRIDYLGVDLDGRRLYGGDAPAYQGGPQPESYDYDFARADGFLTFTDMIEFFEGLYGLPFDGQLIEWKL